MINPNVDKSHPPCSLGECLLTVLGFFVFQMSLRIKLPGPTKRNFVRILMGCGCNLCASLVAQLVKNRLQCRRPQFDSWVRKISWRRDRLPIPVFRGFPGGSDGKESACNVGDLGSIPGLGRSPGEGHGNPLQYSCLENLLGQRSLVSYSPWGCKESGVIH